jgi:hypothetical protein
MDKTHGPIQEEYHAMMNALAEAIDKVFNGNKEGADRETCFVLLTTRFGDIKEGRVNYISNGERSDVVKTMRELIARFEKDGKL